MNAYRCKHIVTAIQWDGTSRDVLHQWHLDKTGYVPRFDDQNTKILMGDEWYAVAPGEWIVWFSDCEEFSVIEDADFRDQYEAMA